MGSKLSFYLEDTATLLRDQGFSFTTQSQLTRWINEARRQCAQRTGCIIRLLTGQSPFGASAQPGSLIPGGGQPGSMPDSFPATPQSTPAPVPVPASAPTVAVNSFQTITGVERYSFTGFINPYLTAQHDGILACIDIMSCSLNWGGGPNGAPRPSLAWLPWDELQAYARAYAVLVMSYPYYFSVLNDGEDGELWLFPVPSQAMEMELVCYCTPKPLHSDDDFDAIPSGWVNSIKFMAAALAFMASGRYAQAQMMEDQFMSRIMSGRVAADRGKTPNYYWSVAS